MEVEILDAQTLSEAEARAIAELVVRVWPKPNVTVEMRQQRILKMGQQNDGTKEQAPKCFQVRDGGQVIAHATFVTRTIGTSAGELTILGLARVCADPDRRGQGLGPAVVRPIFALVDQGLFPFALFQTNQKVRPFYEKLGCCVVEDPVVNSLDDSGDPPFWDEIVMRYPSDKDWPAGEIDLRGPGF